MVSAIRGLRVATETRNPCRNKMGHNARPIKPVPPVTRTRLTGQRPPALPAIRLTADRNDWRLRAR
jgi:hypothetical protein